MYLIVLKEVGQLLIIISQKILLGPEKHTASCRSRRPRCFEI